MRTVLALMVLASGGVARADVVDILSTSRSLAGDVYLNWDSWYDSDDQSFSFTEPGAFDATIDIAARPIEPFFIAAQASHNSTVAPLDLLGQTTVAYQYNVSSGMASGNLQLSSFLLVEFRVNQPVPFEFIGTVADPATIWVSGPGVGFGAYDGTHTESGVFEPGEYSLYAEWAIDFEFDSGTGSGQFAWTAWDFSLQLPAPGGTALLTPVLLAIVGQRPRRWNAPA